MINFPTRSKFQIMWLAGSIFKYLKHLMLLIFIIKMIIHKVSIIAFVTLWQRPSERIIMPSDLENIFDRHFMPFSHFDIYIQNGVYILVEVSFKISTTWRVSLLVDQRVPRAHLAKLYGRFRLICSVFRAAKFTVLKFIEIVIVLVYYTIPFGFSLFRHFWVITFQLLKLHCLAKDHWRGFSTRNAHMVQIVN